MLIVWVHEKNVFADICHNLRTQHGIPTPTFTTTPPQNKCFFLSYSVNFLFLQKGEDMVADMH